MAETNIPNLSIDTVDAASHNSAPTFTLPASASATLAGTVTQSGAATVSGAVTQSGAWTSTATVNLQGAKLLSKQTTASLTSATLKDGELCVGAISVSSAIIYFRSGNTTYRWIAPIAGAVL